MLLSCPKMPLPAVLFSLQVLAGAQRLQNPQLWGFEICPQLAALLSPVTGCCAHSTSRDLWLRAAFNTDSSDAAIHCFTMKYIKSNVI